MNVMYAGVPGKHGGIETKMVGASDQAGVEAAKHWDITRHAFSLSSLCGSVFCQFIGDLCAEVS